jgi:competence protein ComEA
VKRVTVSYASHKLDAWVPDVRIPDGYRERLESLVGGRRDLYVALAVVGAILAGILLLRLRTPTPQIAPPATTPLPATTYGVEPAPTSSTPAGDVFVHVAGAVRRPGLYALSEGSRVADAIEAAGGATGKADLDAVNLAEPLADGAKIDVPRRNSSGEAPTAAPTVTSSAPTSSASPAPATIDINTADAAALETIPGIGPVLAAAIVQHRDENGPFPSVDALLDVSGIGPATLESMRAYVTA